MFWNAIIFDPFTHQNLFAQAATFSASVLGGRDLPHSLHNHFFFLLAVLSRQPDMPNQRGPTLHPHALFSKDFLALMCEDRALLTSRRCTEIANIVDIYYLYGGWGGSRVLPRILSPCCLLLKVSLVSESGCALDVFMFSFATKKKKKSCFAQSVSSILNRFIPNIYHMYSAILLLLRGCYRGKILSGVIMLDYLFRR